MTTMEFIDRFTDNVRIISTNKVYFSLANDAN